MKALLLTGPSKLEVVEFPQPIPAADEVLLRIKACGICGSDLHGWDGSTGRRHPPLVMGHEAAGEIAGLGSKVQGWELGERVTFDSTIFCGQCDYCRKGLVNLCENRRVVGVSPAEYKQDGAFAEFIALPARILHRIPDRLTFEHAAMVEPVSIAVHAVGRVPVKPTDTVVVVGSGMIGLFVIQALRWAGAREIIAVDLSERRLELARQLGATRTFVSGDPNLRPAVDGLTESRGADIAFEVVGLSDTVNLAIRCLRRGGTAVLVGNLAPKVEFPLQQVVTGELTIHGTCGSAGEYPLCLDLISTGIIRVEPIIAAIGKLDDGPEWFRRLSSPEGAGMMKVILVP